MPVVRVSTGGTGEGEGLGTGTTTGLTGDLGRVTSNLALSEHLGRFVAGEVATQFRNENLADLLKGKNMIMISGSWG